jgi:hypothetical protein
MYENPEPGRVLINAHAMSAFGGIAEKRCSL